MGCQFQSAEVMPFNLCHKLCEEILMFLCPLCILTTLNWFPGFDFELCVYSSLSILLPALSQPSSSVSVSHLTGWQINPVSLVPFNQGTIPCWARSSLKVSACSRQVRSTEVADLQSNNAVHDYNALIMTQRKSLVMMCPAVEMVQWSWIEAFNWVCMYVQ